MNHDDDSNDVNHDTNASSIRPKTSLSTSDIVIDNTHHWKNEESTTTNVAHYDGNNDHHHHHPPPVVSKKIRKSVLIDETQNTILRHSNTSTITTTNMNNNNNKNKNNSELFVVEPVSQQAWQLLEEAERHLNNMNSNNSNRNNHNNNNNKSILLFETLSVSSVQHAITALRKAYDINRIHRTKHPQQQQEKEEEEESNAINVRIMNNDDIIMMESEIILYEHIQSFKAIAVDPIQYYPMIFLSSSNNNHKNQSKNQIDDILTDVFIPLLLHDNVDITISVISLLLEWLDHQIITDIINQKNDDDHKNDVVNLFQQCIHKFFTSGIAEVIVDSCDRIRMEQQRNNHRNTDHNNNDEEEEDDDDDVGRGVEDVLALFDNLLDWDMTIMTTITNNKTTRTTTTTTIATVANQICQYTNLISFLFSLQQQPQSEKEDTKSMDLRYRSTELLSALMTREEIYTLDQYKDWTNLPPYHTTTTTTTTTTKNTTPDTNDPLDAMDIILQNVGQYRKRQPRNNEEMEYIENCGIVLTSILTYASSMMMTAFMERQGIELVLRCVKERVYTGAIILNWLDIQGNDISHRNAYEYMIHVGILKYLFPLFMGKHLPKYYDPYENVLVVPNSNTKSKKNRQKKQKAEYYKKIETTTIRILYGFVCRLQDDSPHDAKARFIVKFMDDEMKVQRLIDLYMKYDQQVRLAEYKFYQSDIEDTILDEYGENNKSESVLQIAVMDTKLNAGADILYRLAAMIAFCCCTSKKCHTLIIEQLQNKQSGISIIKDTLQEFISMLDVGTEQRILLQKFQDQI